MNNEQLLHRARTLIAQKDTVSTKLGKIQGELEVIKRNLKTMGVKEADLPKEIEKREKGLEAMGKQLRVRLDRAEKALRGLNVNTDED